MNLVLGSGGRLGKAIVLSLPTDLVAAPSRPVYIEWWRNGAADRVSRYLEDNVNSVGTVYVASGLIDPRLSNDQHHQVNYLLARNVIEGATRLGFRVVTFGTVMETIVPDSSTNPYFASKVRLGNFVEEFSAKCDLALHVRIHTLFGGGPPDEFMFLGQMLHSLVSHSVFKMSPGTQLREYHHLDDEVVGIGRLLASGATGAITLSHGAPVTLECMANFIFNSFKCQELLKIGALPMPVIDNFSEIFERPPVLVAMRFRDTLPALVDYLKTCMKSMNRQEA